MPVISDGGPTTINLIACGSFVPLHGAQSVLQEYPLAHSRRKFADAQDNDPMARSPLSEFQQLYAIEHNAKIKGLDQDQLKEEGRKMPFLFLPA